MRWPTFHTSRPYVFRCPGVPALTFFESIFFRLDDFPSGENDAPAFPFLPRRRLVGGSGDHHPDGGVRRLVLRNGFPLNRRPRQHNRVLVRLAERLGHMRHFFCVRTQKKWIWKISKSNSDSEPREDSSEELRLTINTSGQIHFFCVRRPGASQILGPK